MSMNNDDVQAAGAFAQGMVGEQLAAIADIQLRRARTGEWWPPADYYFDDPEIKSTLAGMAAGRPPEFHSVVREMLASLAVMLLTELSRRDGVPVDELYVRLVPPPEGWKWLDKQ